MKLSLKKNERRALREYLSNLAESLPGRIERVILFGSKARGEGRDSSDTDVLIVISGSKSPAMRLAVADSAFEPIARFAVDISPLVISSAAFRGTSPLVSRIKKEGIEIWTPGKNLLAAA